MRKPVIEVQCSRCARVEHKDLTLTDTDELTPLFEAKLFPPISGSEGARVIKFEDLCGPCYQTVVSLVDQIGAKLKGSSPDRTDRKDRAEGKKKEPAPKAPAPPPAHTAAPAKPRTS